MGCWGLEIQKPMGWKLTNNPFVIRRPASRVKTQTSQNSENHAETPSNVNQGRLLKAKGRRGNTRLPARRVKPLVVGFPTRCFLDFRPPATHATLSASIHFLEQVIITKSPSIKFKSNPSDLANNGKAT